MKSALEVKIDTRVLIKEQGTGKVLLDKSNAIHGQNMARAIARGLAREPNNFIKRIAFGNGGTFTDAAGFVVYNPTNVDSWDSRLYNETYSEIVDELDIANFGSDPGSAEPGNIRIGGGSVPSDDPVGGGVTSIEVGTKSNVVISVFINQNEPTGQIATQGELGEVIVENERCFAFDEIGLYTSGLPATDTSGYSSIDVGNKISSQDSGLQPNTVYNIPLQVDGVAYQCQISTPAGGSGISNAITYGDLCEGINTAAWITGGADISEFVFVKITDRSGGVYPSIINEQTFGLLTFQSKSSGTVSSVVLECNSQPNNLFNVLTNTICENVNVSAVVGQNAGVQNDPVNPANERERLLTHIIFSPIVKTADRGIQIEYTLTVSVAPTSDSVVSQSQM